MPVLLFKQSKAMDGRLSWFIEPREGRLPLPHMGRIYRSCDGHVFQSPASAHRFEAEELREIADFIAVLEAKHKEVV